MSHKLNITKKPVSLTMSRLPRAQRKAEIDQHHGRSRLMIGQANSLATFFISSLLLDLPVGLSQAPCRPDFSHDNTYLLAFQSLRQGPFMLIISKLLMVMIARRFRTAVWWRFIWLNPRSQAADDTGRILRVWTKSNNLAVMALPCLCIEKSSTIFAASLSVMANFLHKLATSASP